MASSRTHEHKGPRVEPYPTVSAYFEALPDGWASFPSCTARASLLQLPRGRGALDALEGMPERLLPRVLLDHHAAGAEWLPEVVHLASLLAVRDARFGDTPRPDEDFLAWLAQLNRDLLGGAAQADVLAVATPAELLPGLPALWERFHRGSPMTVLAHSATHASITLTHPAHLFHPLSLESHRRTLALSLTKGGAAQPHIELRTELSGAEARSVFEARWT